MTHYDYRMVSSIVWSAAYALGTLVMELWQAERRHAKGQDEEASKYVANAMDLHGQIRSRRDFYDRITEDGDGDDGRVRAQG